MKGRHKQTTALKAWVQRWLLVWVVMAWGIVGWGQTNIINTETMYNGSGGSSGDAISTHETNNRFENDALTMSGTGDMRTTSPSSGYTTPSGVSASGTWNVMLNANTEFFLISGINSTGYASISLSFGIKKSTNAQNGSNLTIEVSPDGSSWTSLVMPSLPTGTGTTTPWYHRVCTGIIPATANLRVRFTSSSAEEWRIDDIELRGTIVPINSITTTAASFGPFCNTAANNVSVAYSTTGSFTGAFTAQLSDAAGSFTSPINIGTGTSPIAATIPAGQAAGTGYRIRVVNDNPATTGTDNGSNIIVNAPPTITAQPTNQIVTSPASTSFTVANSGSATYQWQVNTGSGWNDVVNGTPYSGATTNTLTINPSNISYDGHLYRVVLSAIAPCTGSVTSNIVELTVNEGPCVTESFTSMPANNSSYTNRSWTGDAGGTWTATEARTDQTISSSRAICFRRNGVLTSPNYPDGISRLAFTALFPFTETVGNLEVRVNGNLIRTILFSEMNGTTPVDFLIENINISGSYQLTITSTASSGTNSRFALDNIQITCYNACTPTHSISTFTPSEGPAGALVTIIGTGFSGTPVVKFGGVTAASVTFVNSTTLIAEVPSGAISGPVTITQSSCDVTSAGNFTVLSANANCGSGATGTDLIISEVYDAFSGSLAYIELFNPTTASINLSTYNVRIITDGPTITDLPNLTGSLAAGAVGIVRINTGSGDCGISTLLQTNDAAPGFNGNDRIVLRRNGSTDIDVVDNPSYGGSNPPSGDNRRGFSQLRNPGAVTPRTTYQASDWTNTDPESCANLGTAPAAVASRDITINTQPIDVNCTAVTFSVAASPVGTGVTIGGYTWRYSAPGDAGWSTVSSLNGTNGLTVSGSGSNSITITGNTAILRDYQFYVEINTAGSPSCSRYSNAVQYAYESRPYYRSRQSGSWTDLSTWEMSNTEGGGYITPVCQYPVALNSDKVIVQNTHTVNLDVIDVAIDWVNINTGGQLTIGSASQLTFQNGNASGSDFEVNGTLLDRGTSGNGLVFVGGATWSLDNSSSATVIKTHSSSVNNYRDNYQAGIANIPAAANWIYRYNGDGDVTTAAINFFYPNLYFENTTGSLYDFNTNFSALTGSSGTSTIKGNMYIGTTGSAPVVVRHNNINVSPIRVLGNLLVGNGSMLTNVSYNGGVSVGHGWGTGIELSGNIALTGTGSLVSTFNAASPNSGVLTLNGSTLQTISGGSGNISASILTLNNGSNFLLDAITTVDRTMNFTNGYITTNSTNPLTLTPSATTTGGSTNSFVNGPMHKVANDATDDFAFPIGKSGSPNRYRPVTIADFDGAGELTFTAEYFPTGASTHPRDQILGPELVGVWLNQYWQVSKSPGDLAARVGVPYTSGADGWFEVGPGSNSRVGIARFNGTHWDFTKDANDFDDIGPDYFESRGVGETGMVFSDRLSTFSPFTIGHGLNSILVLPIKLLAFDALQQKNNARLSWQVEDEQLLQGFVLEYSTNGTDFNRVATLQPNGTGHYRYLHALAPGMHHYYRLGMRQHNGTLTYSKVVSLVGAATGTTISAVGPNPMVGHMLTIHSQSATGQWMQATLIDATGRTLATTRYTLAAGVNKNLFTLPALASGYYTLLITTRDGTQVALPLVK